MDRQLQLLMSQPRPIATAATLELKIMVASEIVDRNAGRARQRWSASYPFQDEEYRLAVNDAEAYQADPNVGTFASIQADVDAGTIDPRTDSPVTDLAEAADLVLFKRDLYETALASIRALRLAAKAAIKSATTEAEIYDAVKVTWPSPT